jgi:hypothetical protein
MGTNAKTVGPLLIIGAPVGILALLFTAVLLFAPAAAASCTPARAGTADPANVPADAVAGYSGVQLVNAALIMNTATTLGFDRAGQVIGVMTAMGESSLTVIDSGDTAGPDSRGLFQQRDNGVWGTYADRMDPTISATNFYTALQQVDGWQDLELTLAANRVQGNADPFHYEQYAAPADAVVTALSGGTPEGGPGCASGDVVLPLSDGFNITSVFGPRAVPTAGASSWHPAVDLQHWPNNCDDPIYAITGGTVTLVQGYQVSVKAPAGHTVSYLHMRLADVTVAAGDTVTAGQQIAVTGNEGPSTGCHLDLRINAAGTTDTAVSGLAQSQDLGSAESGWVDPEAFFALFGVELCPTESCGRPA